MRLKLDENLGKRGQSILQAAGHDVSTVAHQQLDGTTDEELIEECRREKRGLVSLDLDFANPLRFQPSQYHGIAVLRLATIGTAGILVSPECRCGKDKNYVPGSARYTFPRAFRTLSGVVG